MPNPPQSSHQLTPQLDSPVLRPPRTAVPEELMRPYLHEFLTQAYQEYDIVIWSATGMKWIEVKMRELGDVEFVINVGDRFYPGGVSSKSDPQWDTQ